jgi:hypothetical protein
MVLFRWRALSVRATGSSDAQRKGKCSMHVFSSVSLSHVVCPFLPDLGGLPEGPGAIEQAEYRKIDDAICHRVVTDSSKFSA